jgi:small-conductance mechanosensitive channel
MNEWIAAGIAIAAGVVAGVFVAGVVRRIMSKETRPDVLNRLADPIANLLFSLAVVVGLVVALGIVNPDSLDTLPTDLVNYLPRLLTGFIVVIVGNAAAGLAASATAGALARAGTGAQRTVPKIVRAAILVAALILAADQVGIDTTIITLAVAAVFFSGGAAAALMIGLGSREVTGELAAARALRQMLSEGDVLTIDDDRGTVVHVHSTATELELTGGSRRLIPNSVLMSSTITIERAPSPEAP